MDNRKNYNTPRDRVDDEFLTRLLAEQEPYAAGRRGQNQMHSPTRSRQNGIPSGQTQAVSRQAETGSDEMPCACARQLFGLPADLPLAMVYAPDQEWEDLYGDCEAFRHGTLFRKLDLPFYPGCGCSSCCGS